jgi:hypothetical protein
MPGSRCVRADRAPVGEMAGDGSDPGTIQHAQARTLGDRQHRRSAATTRLVNLPSARGSAVEGALEADAERLHDADARESLVVGGHNGPWRLRRARARDHVGGRHLVKGALLAVAPVLGSDLVPFPGNRLALAEASQVT